jgi:hypothetical protein
LKSAWLKWLTVNTWGGLTLVRMAPLWSGAAPGAGADSALRTVAAGDFRGAAAARGRLAAGVGTAVLEAGRRSATFFVPTGFAPIGFAAGLVPIGFAMTGFAAALAGLEARRGAFFASAALPDAALPGADLFAVERFPAAAVRDAACFVPVFADAGALPFMPVCLDGVALAAAALPRDGAGFTAVAFVSTFPAAAFRFGSAAMTFGFFRATGGGACSLRCVACPMLALAMASSP